MLKYHGMAVVLVDLTYNYRALNSAQYYCHYTATNNPLRN